MAEETLFTISVDAFRNGPDTSDPKEPSVGTNISNPTPKNHTHGHTLENTFENASGDPVKQFIVQNFEQINAMQISYNREDSKKIRRKFLGIRQCSDESLKDYLSGFRKETLHMTDRSDGMMIRAFISRLRRGRLFKDLIARPPKSMEDLFT
ncbi:hypothetical protein Tco_0438011 [Tanacetum coccineum]